MNKDIELLNKALSESGIVPFHAVDQRLVTDLCDIIGALYRELQSRGTTTEQIETAVTYGLINR